MPCRNSIRAVIACSLSALFVAGCASFSSTNKSETSYQSPVRLAQFKIERDRGSGDKVLMVLALSGGGSRAAYLSAMTMLRMEKVFAGEELYLSTQEQMRVQDAAQVTVRDGRTSLVRVGRHPPK